MLYSYLFIELIMYSFIDLSIYKYNIYKDLLIWNIYIYLGIVLILKCEGKYLMFLVYVLLYIEEVYLKDLFVLKYFSKVIIVYIGYWFFW